MSQYDFTSLSHSLLNLFISTYGSPLVPTGPQSPIISLLIFFGQHALDSTALKNTPFQTGVHLSARVRPQYELIRYCKSPSFTPGLCRQTYRTQKRTENKAGRRHRIKGRDKRHDGVLLTVLLLRSTAGKSHTHHILCNCSLS